MTGRPRSRANGTGGRRIGGGSRFCRANCRSGRSSGRRGREQTKMNVRAVRLVRVVGAALVLATSTVAAGAPAAPAVAAGPAFVQARAHEVTNGRTNTVTFRLANRA